MYLTTFKNEILHQVNFLIKYSALRLAILASTAFLATHSGALAVQGGTLEDERASKEVILTPKQTRTFTDHKGFDIEICTSSATTSTAAYADLDGLKTSLETKDHGPKYIKKLELNAYVSQISDALKLANESRYNEINHPFLMMLIAPNRIGIHTIQNLQLGRMNDTVKRNSFDNEYWLSLAEKSSFSEEEKSYLRDWIHVQKDLPKWRQAMEFVKQQNPNYSHPLFEIEFLATYLQTQKFKGWGLRKVKDLQIYDENIESFKGKGLDSLNSLIIGLDGQKTIKFFNWGDIKNLTFFKMNTSELLSMHGRKPGRIISFVLDGVFNPSGTDRGFNIDFKEKNFFQEELSLAIHPEANKEIVLAVLCNQIIRLLDKGETFYANRILKCLKEQINQSQALITSYKNAYKIKEVGLRYLQKRRS